MSVTRQSPPHPIVVELRQLREAAGWSQAQLATRTGVPAVVIGSYERGDRQPTLSTLEQLFTALGQEIAIRPTGSAEPDYTRSAAQMAIDLRAIAAQLDPPLTGETR